MATFTIDAQQAFATLDGLERRLSELEASSKRTAAATRQVFSPGGDLARREIAALDQAQREYQELATITTRLKAARDAAFDPRAVQTYTRAVDAAEAEMRKLEQAATSVGVDLRKALEPPKTQGFGSALFGQLKTAALSAAAGISFGTAIAEGVRLNAEYERVRTSLGVILKDVNKADQLLAKLNQFAAETPFGTDQINQAATALLAFGESETTVVKTLRKIGDISAATGKDFNELTTIYGKARVAGVLYAEDINQLVEAGVPIIGEFAKQMGVSEGQVKKLASEGKIGFNQLQTAFTNLTGEGGRFEGMLQKQSQTLDGLASSFKDNLAVALRETFAPLVPLLKDAIKFATDLLGVTKSQSQVLEQERVAFLATANQINLTNVGTETRTKLINTLKQQYPQFLGQINAEKVTNEQLQPILDKINQSYVIRIALQKQQEKIAPLLEAQAERETTLAESRVKYNQLLIQGAEAAGVNLRALKTETEQRDAVVSALRKQAEFQTGVGFERPLNLQAKLLNGISAQLSKIDASNIRNVAATNRVTEAEKERQAVIEQLRKTYGELFDIATAPPPKSPTSDAPAVGGTDTGKKKETKTAAEIAFEKREKDLQIRQLLLNDLEEGLEKELETIRLHFDQLRLEYERAGLDISKLAEKQAETEFDVFVKFVNAPVDNAPTELDKRRDEAAANNTELARIQAGLEKKRQIAEQEIEIAEEKSRRVIAVLKASGASEKEIAETTREFDLQIQRARLEAQLRFEQAMLEAVGGSNQEMAEGIRRNIKLLQAQLSNVNFEIETPQTPDAGGKKGKKQSLWDFLGIDTQTEEGEAFAAQAEQMAQRVIGAIQEMAAARVAAAEEEVQASDDRISKIESELDREIALAEAGFASDVSLKRRELEEEKKKNAKAREEAEKAKRSQMLIDTAIQASSLITAIANLFKSLSQIPFGIGVPIAIALSGAMIAFFIKSKVDAAKAAKARHGMSGFIDGRGIVTGKYHSHGGQTLEVERGEMVQVADDGTRRRVEVVRRERAAEYMDLLRAANKGDRRALAEQALKLADIETLPLSVRKSVFADLAIDRVSRQMTEGPVVRQKRVTSLVFGAGEARPVQVEVNSKDTRRTNELLLQLIQLQVEQGRRPQWSADGKTKTNGSYTTKYNT